MFTVCVDSKVGQYLKSVTLLEYLVFQDTLYRALVRVAAHTG